MNATCHRRFPFGCSDKPRAWWGPDSKLSKANFESVAVIDWTVNGAALCIIVYGSLWIGCRVRDGRKCQCPHFHFLQAYSNCLLSHRVSQRKDLNFQILITYLVILITASIWKCLYAGCEVLVVKALCHLHDVVGHFVRVRKLPSTQLAVPC